MKITNRWVALLIVCVCFAQLTINWFDVIPLIGGWAAELRLAPVEIGSIIGAFLIGYGVLHIPAGIACERLGVRPVLIIGVVVEAAGAIWTSQAGGYGSMFAARVIAGAGGGAFLAGVVGLTAQWFREHEMATATALIFGVTFVGAAGIALYEWGALGAAFGWRTALLVGLVSSAVSLVGLIFIYPEPPGQEGDVVEERRKMPSAWIASVKRVFGNSRLWILGFAGAGGYGAYLTAPAVLPSYASKVLGLSSSVGATVSSFLLFSGIVGSLIGGIFTDKIAGFTKTFFWSLIIEGVVLLIVPLASTSGSVTLLAFWIGAVPLVSISAWIALPGLMTRQGDVLPEDVPTAAGFLLTLGAISGAVLPVVFEWFGTQETPKNGWVALGLITIALSLLAIYDFRTQRVRSGAVM